MEPTLEQQLEAIKRDLEKQEQAWHAAKQALARLDAKEIAVPRELIDCLEHRVAVPVAPVVHGIRG